MLERLNLLSSVDWTVVEWFMLYCCPHKLQRPTNHISRTPSSSSELLGQLCKRMHMTVHGHYWCFCLNCKVFMSAHDLHTVSQWYAADRTKLHLWTVPDSVVNVVCTMQRVYPRVYLNSRHENVKVDVFCIGLWTAVKALCAATIYL